MTGRAATWTLTRSTKLGLDFYGLRERLKAMVEARPGVGVDDLSSFVGERLADYKVPKEWELVDELPRDSSGKVRKRLLRDAHWTDRPTKV